jgi:hypothetical protein
MKKQKRIQVLHWLNNGHYPGYVMFSCGFSYDELIKLLRRKKADGWVRGIENDKVLFDDSTALCSQRTIKALDGGKDLTLQYIYIKDSFDFSDKAYVTLAHECVHLCQFFLPDININRDVEIESEAYYHSHIMKQCLDILRGIKK